jgi:beta-N-acetylhexosaminidase
MAIGAFICGCRGLEFTPDEIAFVRESDPWGFILFKRNIDSPDQVRALTGHFRKLVGRDDAPVLVDQEGGRVQRLGPPHWPSYPAARRFGEIYAGDPLSGLAAARWTARLIADDLYRLGITVDCLPVGDVPQPGSHDVIGDRAYAEAPEPVALLARAAMTGLMGGGVLPVVKHVPGHGRAHADSHLSLPVVDAPREALERCDFVPFAALADAPMAMTAHVVYSALDPETPATLSADIIGSVIREDIGFAGLLMSDDLSMKALAGSLGERAGGAIAAGCDIALHCNGDLEEMEAVAANAGTLTGPALIRAETALACARPPLELDRPGTEQRLAEYAGRAGVKLV